MFASICSFTKNDPLCMTYHPYHFVGEVLLHPVDCKNKVILTIRKVINDSNIDYDDLYMIHNFAISL